MREHKKRIMGMTAVRDGSLCAFGGGSGSRSGGTQPLEVLLNCGVPCGRHVGQCPEENAVWEDGRAASSER